MLEFFISPVRLDTAPGVPMPTTSHVGCERAQLVGQPAGGLDDVLVAARLLGRHPAPRDRPTVGAEHDALDLRSPEVDADAVRRPHGGCVASR